MAHFVSGDKELAPPYHPAGKNSPVWRQYLASQGVEDTLEDFLVKKERVAPLRLDPLVDDLLLPSFARDLWWVWAGLALIGSQLGD